MAGVIAILLAIAMPVYVSIRSTQRSKRTRGIVAAIAAGDLAFDLTGNGIVDSADLVQWLMPLQKGPSSPLPVGYAKRSLIKVLR